MYDAISLAVKAALHNTALPKTTDIHTDGNNVDLQFSDSMADCWHLDLTKAPCLVTLCKVCIDCKICMRKIIHNFIMYIILVTIATFFFYCKQLCIKYFGLAF